MKYYTTTSKLLLILCFHCIISQIQAQCPVSSFTISSPVCAGLPLQISNSSVGANSYKWDFSPGFFLQPGVKSGDTLLNLSYPGDITSMMQNDTLIIFLSGWGDGKLHRLTYGDGPGAPATLVEDLGNMGVFSQPADVAFYNNNGNWYGFVVDNYTFALHRFHLGNNLKNTPDSAATILNFTNSNFTGPKSIKIFTDSTGTIYGIVGNTNNGPGSFTILDFGNSILNTPAASIPINVPGQSAVRDVIVNKNCDGWHAFIGGSSNLVRADFGNSIMNPPVFTNIVSGGITPSDLVLIEDSSHWKILCTEMNSWRVRKFDLGTDITNNSPVDIGFEFFAGYQNPKGICYVRKDNTSYIFTLNESKRVITVSYTNTMNANIAFSTDAAPNNIVFNTGGTFPVTLIATDALGFSSMETQTVTVSDLPHINFSTNNKCFGDTTSFLDSSFVSGGTVTGWLWHFGDGDSSALQNPLHQYLGTGTFNITIDAIASTGCSSTFSDSIRITTRPTVSFISPSIVCSQSDLQFTDQSTDAMSTINQWSWQFGNGDTSVSQNPLYSYPLGGNFQVTLTAATIEGCSNSAAASLSINDRPDAGFSTANTCVGQPVQFNDQSSINNSTIQGYNWDFGDGNSDVTANPTHTYGGGVNTYTAKLIVTASNGCVDTLMQSVKVNNIPTVNFSIQPVNTCKNNDIYFTDLSSVAGDTISKWYWDFGNNIHDSTANPVHRFASAGLKTVSLISYSPSSCPGVIYQQTVNVLESPVAAFNSSLTCIGGSTHFTNNSIPASGSSIDTIVWKFNGTDISNINSPDYTFASTGSFPVTLTVISPEGCMSLDSQQVDVHAQPTTGFTNTNACEGSAVHFTNSSASDSLSTISQYEWSFGDPASGSANYSSLQNPVHTFDTTLTFAVSLITTTNFGCKDTAIKSLTAARAPDAHFTYSPTCYGDLMEFFNPGSVADSSYVWNFGDNQTNQLREPAHYYAFAGVYTVYLTVLGNSGCSASATKQVTVSPIPTADFVTTPACINTNYIFQDNSHIVTGSIKRWDWNVGGTLLSDTSNHPSYTFTDTGTYNVTLTVLSDIGCGKSTTKAITAHAPPISSFSYDPQYGNPPLDIHTEDLSTGGANYSWDFGDGSAINYLQAPTHIYADTGWFKITQYVTSAFGCNDSSYKKIYVIKPVLDIAVTGDSSYYDGEYFHIVASIENRGTREISTVRMESNLENGNTIQEQYTDQISTGTGGYKSYKFHAAFLINNSNEFDYYCIRALSPNGEEDQHPADNERCFNMTDKIIMINPFPNPFTSEINFRFLLPKSENIKIELLDVTGKVLKTVFDGKASKNLFEVKCKMEDLSDGVYLARIIYRDQVVVKSVVKNSNP